MSSTTTAKPRITNSSLIQAAEKRIHTNQKMANRYKAILYGIVLFGFGTVVSSGIISLIYGLPGTATLVSSVVVFCASAFTMLAITYREEEITYDKIIVAERKKRRTSSPEV